MIKFSIPSVLLFVALVVLFTVLLSGHAFGEEKPMTHAQAVAMIAAWGPEVTADKVVVLDWLLRQDPVATLPTGVFALKGRDLAVGWDPQYIAVTFASPFPDRPPPIDRLIPLKDKAVKDFVPRLSPWPVVMGIAAAALGAVVADELLPLPPFAKQAAATGIGVGAGLIVWFAWPG